MSDQKTDELVRRWDNAVARIERLKQELNSAECDLRNATAALARWLTPEDGVEDEKFSIWIEGRLLSVYYDKKRSSGVVWERRKRKE